MGIEDLTATEKQLLIVHEGKRTYDEYLRAAAGIVASARNKETAKAAIDILAHTLPGAKERLKDQVDGMTEDMMGWINNRYNLSMYGGTGVLEITKVSDDD